MRERRPRGPSRYIRKYVHEIFRAEDMVCMHDWKKMYLVLFDALFA